ncbi:MAG: hypoxanthine phosphoribosyltransferase [Lactobacillaceae bacterium]|jgi:hypoxanthine phosphoribosyltransferase|nr:hypoxanthine phosphoribosyltransferase [Lactobacillaceae bacterium]
MKNNSEDIKETIDNRFSEILFDKNDIEKAAQRVAEQINNDYVNTTPVLVVVLKGAVMWAGDLFKYVSIDAETDFINISSYKGGTKSSGQIELITDLTVDINGRDVILIEDIVDTGLSLDYLKKMLVNERGAKSVAVATMLNKNAVRKADVSVEYVGFDIDDVFIVGYGLDYKEIWRNIPFVGIINPEVI